MKIISEELLQRLVSKQKAADEIEDKSDGETYVPLADRECLARVTLPGHRMSAWLVGAEIHEDDASGREVMLYGFVDLVGPDCAEWGPISLEEWETSGYTFKVEELSPGRPAKEVIPRIYRI